MVSVVVIYSMPQLLVGVLLTGVVLIEEMCQVNPDSLVHFKRVSVLHYNYYGL